MRTIRRLYLYLVAFLSLEGVLWGLISLAREALDATTTLGGGAERLATALALLLVGVPVFGVHWGMAQGLARREEEERASSTRALFLYGVLIATLIPCVQNFLALCTRALLTLTNLPTTLAWIGRHQTWSDNGIALVMNALAAVYFWLVLRADWQILGWRPVFADVRRLYRYVWMLYGLILLLIGVHQLLYFVLRGQEDTLAYHTIAGGWVNGLALTVIGTAVWLSFWLTIQHSLTEEAERQSLLRLALLYLLSLVGVGAVLTSGAIVVYWILRVLLGETMPLTAFLENVAKPLATAIAIGGLWGYYATALTRALQEVPDAPQRAAMRRFYLYLLAGAGLTATVVGLNLLLRFITYMVWAEVRGGTGAVRSDLAASLATLLAALPLWWFAWRPMQREASRSGEAGDHARRSVLRKAYLYLALFAGVVGGMVSAGRMLYHLLLTMLGEPPAGLTLLLLDDFRLLALFILLAVYHGLALREDNRLAAVALAEKHAAFPVLVLDPEDGFAQTMAAAIRGQAPVLPVTFLPVSRDVAVESSPRAVVLPADVAFTLPSVWREWLENFDGYRLLVPRKREKWVWSGAPADEVTLRQAALTLRHLAEGRPLRPAGVPSTWLIALSILGGLFLLQILVGLLMMAIGAILD